MSLRELPLLFAIFLDLVGFGMAFPDVQLRAEVFGAPGWLIGMVLSSYFLTQLIVSPHWGALSDRIGRKPVLLGCTVLSALSMLVYAFAGTVWLILASRVLAGFAAANVVVGQAYIADITPEKDRHAAMGRVSAAILMGLVAGPAIGGELAAVGGNYLMGLTAASASTLSCLWILFGVKALPPSSVQKPGARQLFAIGLLRDVAPLRRIFFVSAAGWFSLACLEGTFGRLIERLFGYGQREFGWVFSYESLLGAGVGLLLAWISRRMAALTILRLGYTLQGVGLALNPLAPWVAAGIAGIAVPGVIEPAFVALLIASTVYGLGVGIANPTINTVCSALAPSDRQGEMFGLLQGARSVGFLAGPILGGLLFDWQPAAPYYLAGAVALGAAALVKIPERAEQAATAVASA